jgi:hypothetical protein
VVLRYLLCAAGDITTSDVDLAAASGGMVVGFNLNPDENVLSHAKQLGERYQVLAVTLWQAVPLSRSLASIGLAAAACCSAFAVLP